MLKKSKRAYRGFLRNKLLGFGRYALWLINYRKDSDFYGIGKVENYQSADKFSGMGVTPGWYCLMDSLNESTIGEKSPIKSSNLLGL